MELDEKTKSRVWWAGAAKAALKGIPQGIVLGLVAGAVLFGGLWALGTIGAAIGATTVVGGAMVGSANFLAGAFGPFIYGGLTQGVSATFASAFNPAAIILFNSVLTAVGNFISGGKIAVNAYKQDVEHRMNEVRISQIEARELQLEQQLPPRSRVVQKIIENGPRHQSGFEHAEEARDAQQADKGHTIH